MHKSARLSAILEQLATGNGVDVNGLAKELDASPATIRRDLATLERQRLLERTHGGAVYLGARKDCGHCFARAAANSVTEGMAVGLTGGTTATEVARALADRPRLTIVTNALNIAAELGVRPNIKLIVTGGLARSQTYELSGPIAEASLAGLTLDVAFIGVDGVDAKAGCTTHEEVEAHTNQVMIRHAQRAVLVADSSKIGKVTFARICPARDVDELITDRGADPGAVQALSETGMQVTLV